MYEGTTVFIINTNSWRVEEIPVGSLNSYVYDGVFFREQDAETVLIKLCECEIKKVTKKLISELMNCKEMIM